MRRTEFLLVTGLLAFVAAPAWAQQGGQQGPAQKSAPAEPELKFEREIFIYPANYRRDPFAPLQATDDGAPRFEELTLRGIIYSPDGQSVVVLSDPGGRLYRVRRGEAVGNARVVSIAPMRVVFAVENFGVVRQEELELKRKDNGGKRG